MFTITTAKMWSEKEQAIVDWTLQKESDVDEGGTQHEFVAMRHNDELHKLSPNVTDEDIILIIKNTNEGHTL